MLPMPLQRRLVPAAQAAIARVLAHGGARTAAPRGEVAAVKTMTLDGFDEIAAAWSPILKKHGYQLELQAVFCHSRPQVLFDRVPSPFAPPLPSPKGRCELADLLIVIDHRGSRSQLVDRRAVLVQAKMLKGGVIKPGGREWLQHELLAWLPSFEFVDPGYDPRSRDLNGSVGDPRLSAEYGSIDFAATPPEWRHWLPRTSSPPFTEDIELGSYLGRMVTGARSCSRAAAPGGADDWSFTIDELLQVTGALPIVKSASTVLRGHNNIIGMIVDTSASGGLEPARYSGIAPAIGGGGGDDMIEPEDEWPEGPMSAVHMTLSGLDEVRRD